MALLHPMLSMSLNYFQRTSPSTAKTPVKLLDRLRKPEDIVVTKPDRGSGIVVMAKSEHVRLLSATSIDE